MPPRKVNNKFRRCQICGICSGSNSENNKRIFMSRFPLDADRCRQWVKLVGKEDLAYVPIEKLHELKFICGNHFEDKDFNKKKSRLIRSAIPSKNFYDDPLPDDMLIDFPSHVFSKIYIPKNHEPSVIRYKGVSQSQVDTIAGPCNSGV
ncbi:uncharacterized protein LOC134675560 [Cydia fagiglandana]|uniref:uncharacterized protein LOC134675560 n=1 Tax=Cydia fagiglandana TaxID=1458189 RepID=UPI002FEE041A